MLEGFKWDAVLSSMKVAKTDGWIQMYQKMVRFAKSIELVVFSCRQLLADWDLTELRTFDGIEETIAGIDLGKGPEKSVRQIFDDRWANFNSSPQKPGDTEILDPFVPGELPKLVLWFWLIIGILKLQEDDSFAELGEESKMGLSKFVESAKASIYNVVVGEHTVFNKRVDRDVTGAQSFTSNALITMLTLLREKCQTSRVSIIATDPRQAPPSIFRSRFSELSPLLLIGSIEPLTPVKHAGGLDSAGNSLIGVASALFSGNADILRPISETLLELSKAGLTTINFARLMKLETFRILSDAGTEVKSLGDFELCVTGDSYTRFDDTTKALTGSSSWLEQERIRSTIKWLGVHNGGISAYIGLIGDIAHQVNEFHRLRRAKSLDSSVISAFTNKMLDLDMTIVTAVGFPKITVTKDSIYFTFSASESSILTPDAYAKMTLPDVVRLLTKEDANSSPLFTISAKTGAAPNPHSELERAVLRTVFAQSSNVSNPGRSWPTMKTQTPILRVHPLVAAPFLIELSDFVTFKWDIVSKERKPGGSVDHLKLMNKHFGFSDESVYLADVDEPLAGAGGPTLVDKS